MDAAESTKGVRRIAPPDERLIEHVKDVLHRYVEKMGDTFQSRSTQFEEQPELARELRLAGHRYRRQAHQAVELIRRGGFSLGELRHVAGTLYLTDLTIRWILEQQTETFRKMLHHPQPELGRKIEIARLRIDLGEVEEGLKELLRLVAENRSHYPLIMTMGFVYLRVKQNLAYAMRYFEKAATISAHREPEHYRALAFQFLAVCNEGQKRYKNALNTLQHALSVNPRDPALHYSIARMHGRLGNDRKAVEHFDIALRRHPAFYAMALIDDSFDPVRGPLHEKMLRYNEEFRQLGTHFEQMLDRVMVYVIRFKLDQSHPQLRSGIETMRKQLQMVRGGCYSGYRVGIQRFFRTVFPGVFQDLEKVLVQKKKQLDQQTRRKARRSRKRVKLLRWLFVPLGAAAGGALLWLQPEWRDWILQQLPLQVPSPEFLLTGLGAAIAAGLLYLVTGSARSNIRKDVATLGDMGSARRSLDNLERRLDKFWSDQVQPQIEALAEWSEESDDQEEGAEADHPR